MRDHSFLNFIVFRRIILNENPKEFKEFSVSAVNCDKVGHVV